MAEAVAVIGLVASIVQLAEFGAKVLHRLNEFQSSLGEIPKTFQHVKAELPILLETLEQMRLEAQNGSMREETKQALLDIVNGCQKQLTRLDELIKRTLPQQSDSWRTRTGKAILSLRQDTKVAAITANIQRHIQTLTNYKVATLPARGTINHGKNAHGWSDRADPGRSAIYPTNSIVNCAVST
jgi:N-terminal domain on NACHT_NTPase and P-loop NTPases